MSPTGPWTKNPVTYTEEKKEQRELSRSPETLFVALNNQLSRVKFVHSERGWGAPALPSSIPCTLSQGPLWPSGYYPLLSVFIWHKLHNIAPSVCNLILVFIKIIHTHDNVNNILKFKSITGLIKNTAPDPFSQSLSPSPQGHHRYPFQLLLLVVNSMFLNNIIILWFLTCSIFGILCCLPKGWGFNLLHIPQAHTYLFFLSNISISQFK